MGQTVDVQVHVVWCGSNVGSRIAAVPHTHEPDCDHATNADTNLLVHSRCSKVACIAHAREGGRRAHTAGMSGPSFIGILTCSLNCSCTAACAGLAAAATATGASAAAAVVRALFGACTQCRRFSKTVQTPWGADPAYQRSQQSLPQVDGSTCHKRHHECSRCCVLCCSHGPTCRWCCAHPKRGDGCCPRNPACTVKQRW
jgi:hypothetical protein